MIASFHWRVFAAVLFLLCAFSTAAYSQDDPEKQLEKIRTKILTQGKVCSDPNRPCPEFEANELSFKIAKKFDFDRGQAQSLPFYAVMLKSGELCKIPESEASRGAGLVSGPQSVRAPVLLPRFRR